MSHSGHFSNVGMWGSGLYFATKAAYSDSANGGYAYKVGGGPQKQLFVCKVLTGDCKEIPYKDGVTSVLKMPPVKPRGAPNPEEIHHESFRYDSVCGTAVNSMNYGMFFGIMLVNVLLLLFRIYTCILFI